MTDRAAADKQQSRDQRPTQTPVPVPQVEAVVSASTRALTSPDAVSDLPGSIRRHPSSILSLQRTVGNAAVARILRETELELRRDEEDEVDEEITGETEPEVAEEPEVASDPEPSESSSGDAPPPSDDEIVEETGESEPAPEPEDSGEVIDDEGTPETTDDEGGEVIDDEGTPETTDDEGGEVIDDEGTPETTDDEGGEVIDDEGTDVEEDDGPLIPLPFNLDTMIVDDDAMPEDGQMTKGSFLSQLRSTVVPQATSLLAESGSDVDVGAGSDFWISKISGLGGSELQRAINLYAPATLQVESAAEMIPIVAAKVMKPIRIWASTGEIIDVPDIPGLGTPLFDPGAFFKSAGDAVPGSQDPLVLRARLGPGEPMSGDSGRAMESAFGQNFDDVRIHRDSIAATLASGLDARAFTVGSHIAFAAGEHQPGTPVGDALIAHELAHVAQQRLGAASGMQARGSGDENEYEADADRTAISVVAALHGGRAGLTAWAKTLGPNLKSGLRLQRCKSKGDAPKLSVPTNEEVGKHAAAISDLMGRPNENADAIKAKLAELGPYAGHVLLKVNVLADRKQMTIFAGAEKGPGVIQALIESLQNGDYAAFASQLRPNGEDPDSKVAQDNGRSIALQLQRILDSFNATPAEIDKDTAAEINRLNTVLAGDSRFDEYKKAGVRLPVTIFNPGTERDGGIYYDPKLGEEGVTEAVQLDKGVLNPVRINIRIGRKALIDDKGTLHTDAFVRSAMNHEFQHFKQYIEFRDPAKNTDPRIDQLKVDESLPGKRAANAEVEAVTAQLVFDIADMTSDAEVKSLLGYLAEKWNWATDDTRGRSIALMKDQSHPLGAKDGIQKKRLLGLIKAMGLHTSPKRKKGSEPNADLSSLFQALST